MGNRKLPFGYQMRMGEVVRNEPEAKAVQDHNCGNHRHKAYCRH